MPNASFRVPVIIASGASLSGPVDLQGATLVGIEMPDTWTAASITLQAKSDPASATFFEAQRVDALNGAAVAIQFNVAQAIYYSIINVRDLSALRYVKVRSGTSGTPVAQAAERSFYLIAKYI